MIDESANIAPDTVVGPYAVVHAGASIGAGARLGGDVVVHPGTVVGAGGAIQDGAERGRPPKLRRGVRDAPPGLIVGDGCVVCCGAILLAGARLEGGVIVG